MGYHTFFNNDGVPQCTPVKLKTISIMIFDDVACEKQDNIRPYFCMGRHKKNDSFYLSEIYSHISKHLICDNFNFIIMFKQDDLSMRAYISGPY